MHIYLQRGACGVCGARGAVFRDTPDSKMGYGGEVHHPTILGLGLGLGGLGGELRVGVKVRARVRVRVS